MKAICKCKLKELLSEAEDATKFMGLEFYDLIDSLSIEVVKCYKTIFDLKYLVHCYGGMISFGLIIVQTLSVIIVAKINIPKMKIISFNLLYKYLHLLRIENNKNYPSKKSEKTSSNKGIKIIDNSISINDSKSKINQLSFKKF